jgi:hypothetical protein
MAVPTWFLFLAAAVLVIVLLQLVGFDVTVN